MEFRLKRRFRLAQKERFRQVRQGGKSFSHRLVVACVLRNEVGHSRSGITVSRRVGGAVVRNRARRRIDEAIRLTWESVDQGWDVVWVARPPIVRAAFPEIQSACEQLLRRAGLFRTHATHASGECDVADMKPTGEISGSAGHEPGGDRPSEVL